MKIKILILASIIFLLFACGKKTDPVPLDTIVIPEVEIEKAITLSDSGVLIKNTGNYVLYIEKAETVNDCVQEYKLLAKVNPKSHYSDEYVIRGNEYIYRLFNVDEDNKVASKGVTKKITFNYPIKIEKFEYDLIDERYLKANLTFSDEVGYYEIYINSKLVKKSKQLQMELSFEDKNLNTVEIIPYDRYFNKGIVFKKDFIAYSKYLLPEVKGIKFIDRGDTFILSWDSVSGAKGYKIYFIDNNDKKLIETVKENFQILQKNDYGCEYAISAFNDYTESNFSTIDICGSGAK